MDQVSGLWDIIKGMAGHRCFGLCHCAPRTRQHTRASMMRYLAPRRWRSARATLRRWRSYSSVGPRSISRGYHRHRAQAFVYVRGVQSDGCACSAVRCAPHCCRAGGQSQLTEVSTPLMMGSALALFNAGELGMNLGTRHVVAEELNRLDPGDQQISRPVE